MQESTHLTDATIPLLSIVGFLFLLGYVLVMLLQRCTPNPASSAIAPRAQRFAQRVVRNPTLIGVALMFQAVLLSLMAVAIGLNAWTDLTWKDLPGTLHFRFGVYFVVLDQTGQVDPLTAWYSCDLEPKATSVYQRTCRTFRAGAILVMVFECILAVAGLTAMVLLVVGSYRQKFPAAAYKAQAITCISGGAAVFTCQSRAQAMRGAIVACVTVR